MHAYAALMLLGKHRRRPYSLPQATVDPLDIAAVISGCEAGGCDQISLWRTQTLRHGQMFWFWCVFGSHHLNSEGCFSSWTLIFPAIGNFLHVVVEWLFFNGMSSLFWFFSLEQNIMPAGECTRIFRGGFHFFFWIPRLYICVFFLHILFLLFLTFGSQVFCPSSPVLRVFFVGSKIKVFLLCLIFVLWHPSIFSSFFFFCMFAGRICRSNVLKIRPRPVINFLINKILIPSETAKHPCRPNHSFKRGMFLKWVDVTNTHPAQQRAINSRIGAYAKQRTTPDSYGWGWA